MRHRALIDGNTGYLAEQTARSPVWTGVNGPGKSHLLKAIELKHVSVLGLENPNIIHFDYESFRLENESAFNSHQLSSEREAA
jgi:hypothetical protein